MMCMMKKLIPAIALLLCFAGCITDSKSDEDNNPGLLSVGVDAPDFTIYPSDYPEGLALSELRGKYVVVEFWASWCPDCRRETENMKALYTDFHSEDVVFIGYSFDTDEEAWATYIAENEMNWLQYSEFVEWKDCAVATAYDVRWIPTFYLIDRDGRVACATVEYDEIREVLSQL